VKEPENTFVSSSDAVLKTHLQSLTNVKLEIALLYCYFWFNYLQTSKNHLNYLYWL